MANTEKLWVKMEKAVKDRDIQMIDNLLSELDEADEGSDGYMESFTDVLSEVKRVAEEKNNG